MYVQWSFITKICTFSMSVITPLGPAQRFYMIVKRAAGQLWFYVKTFWLTFCGGYHENYTWTFFLLISFH